MQEVAEEVIRAIKNPEYKLIVVNFANGDMVGHTAVKDAIIEAMNELDSVIGGLYVKLLVQMYQL